jgi:TRAP-type mannitol/chloroaromatic compound transport system permease small subunit
MAWRIAYSEVGAIGGKPVVRHSLREGKRVGFHLAIHLAPATATIAAILLIVAAAVLWTLLFDRHMSALIALARVIDRVTAFIGKAVSWLILLAVLVSAGNAISRKAFDVASNAWLELQWYLFGAAYLLAAAYTLQQNEHIRIDILYNMYSRRRQNIVDLFGHVFFLMPFVLLMLAYFFPYVLLSFHSGEVSTNAGGLIIWPGKLMLLLGFALLALQGVSEIIKKIAIMRGLMPDEHLHVATHQSLDDIEELDPSEIR